MSRKTTELDYFDKEAKDEFEKVKKIMEDYCDSQIKLLNSIKPELTSSAEKELKKCISSFETAKTTIAEKEFIPPSGVTSTMKGVGGVAAIVGLVMLGGPAGLGVSCGLIAGGGATAGVGALMAKAQDKCSKDSLMRPLVDAERQTEKFFSTYKSNYKEELPKSVKTDVDKFRTESANFKKRMALYVIGAVHIAAAAVILAASHGALAPVALKIAMVGAKNISAGMAAGAIVSKSLIGTAAIALGAKMNDTRSKGLTDKIEGKETPSQETTPLNSRH